MDSATKLSVYISFVSRYTPLVDCTQMGILLELSPILLTVCTIPGKWVPPSLPALHEAIPHPHSIWFQAEVYFQFSVAACLNLTPARRQPPLRPSSRIVFPLPLRLCSGTFAFPVGSQALMSNTPCRTRKEGLDRGSNPGLTQFMKGARRSNHRATQPACGGTINSNTP